MAYAFLKGLGVDGNIGTITLDLSGNSATATDGQKVLGVKDGAVDLESTKYPFCFLGDARARIRRRVCWSFCRSTRI